MMKKIRNLNDYKSLSQLISEETEKGFLQKKIYLKVKSQLQTTDGDDNES